VESKHEPEAEMTARHLSAFDRRAFLRTGTASTAACLSGWLAPLAAAAGPNPQRKRACILLWMNGGPSTIDLWDIKEGHANGGPTKSIATTAPGLRISEHLPNLAKFGDRMALLRGMSTKEGDHSRATFLMKTGQLPQGAIEYPTIGALLSKETGNPAGELPNFVSIAPRRFFDLNPNSAGFLGPNYAPLVVGEANDFFEPTGDTIADRLRVENLAREKDIPAAHADSRLALLRDLHDDFAAGRPSAVTKSHVAAYDRATRLMQSTANKAFDLKAEKPEVRAKYGKSLFGQGCLLARRLVERGVAFVEVTLSGWDTHQQNFEAMKTQCGHLDAGFGGLMADLKDRGLLDSTLVICMGEFGRTPRINGATGRDHYPAAWASVLAGGGIRGGTVAGKTSPDGTAVETRKTTTNDLLATICGALGVDPERQNLSNVGRPIRIVEKGAEAVAEVLA
jgi:hypothetical protein